MSCGRWDGTIRGTLERNVGQVCTVFPVAGGLAGDGFTGIVTQVDDEVCRLSTFDNGNSRCARSGRTPLGNIKTIPLNSIACVSSPER